MLGLLRDALAGEEEKTRRPVMTELKQLPTACYKKADQHVSHCHGAMAAMGLTIGKNGQLVISNKKA